jgi:hypothetical protein
MFVYPSSVYFIVFQLPIETFGCNFTISFIKFIYV